MYQQMVQLLIVKAMEILENKKTRLEYLEISLKKKIMRLLKTTVNKKLLVIWKDNKKIQYLISVAKPKLNQLYVYKKVKVI